MGRLSALDGLRAFAIMAVIGFHYEARYVGGGDIGVTVFFVLSGWLITTLLVREFDRTGRIDTTQFMRRRLLRLYPALAAVVCVVVPTAVIVGPTHHLAAGVYGAVLYLNDLFMPWNRSSGWLDPTWSLAVEFQFYLAWPFVMTALLRRTDTITAAGVLFAGAIVMGGVSAVTASLFNPAWTYFTPLGSIAPLLAGSAVALREVRPTRRQASAAALVLTALCFVPNSAANIFHGAAQLAIVASAVVVSYLAANSDARVLSDRRVVWLGQRSYGVYLIHQAVLLFIVSAFNNPPAQIVALTGIPASIVLAALSYTYVERPFLKRKDEAASQPSSDLIRAFAPPAPILETTASTITRLPT